jgi:hypothetical protein
MKTVGSRAEVMHGTAEKTSGGLTKKDLYRGKDGEIHSKAMKKRGKSKPLAMWVKAKKEIENKLGKPILPDDMPKHKDDIREVYDKLMKKKK